uniref:Alpha-chemokine UL146 n=1 Tax=Human cytomegalovirus TaxID=10359 RepID=B5L779_HCMV|nr:alpha-chemokine UL146 [Human betaherpesvirus 5]
MRFIFGLLIGLVIVYTYYYEVQSTELRCPCTNGLHDPLYGIFYAGRDPPRPPDCEKDQYYLKPPKGKAVCLGPHHHLSIWLNGQNSSLWHKVLVTGKNGNGPHVTKKGDFPRGRKNIMI